MKQTISIEFTPEGRGMQHVNVEVAVPVGVLRFAVQVRPPRGGNPLQEEVGKDRARRDALREAMTYLVMDPRFPV